MALQASRVMRVANEELRLTAIAGHIESMVVHRKGTGMGSVEEEPRFLDLTREHTALSTEGWKVQKVCARGIGEDE